MVVVLVYCGSRIHSVPPLRAHLQDGLDRRTAHHADHLVDPRLALPEQFDQRNQQLPVLRQPFRRSVGCSAWTTRARFSIVLASGASPFCPTPDRYRSPAGVGTDLQLRLGQPPSTTLASCYDSKVAQSSRPLWPRPLRRVALGDPTARAVRCRNPATTGPLVMTRAWSAPSLKLLCVAERTWFAALCASRPNGW